MCLGDSLIAALTRFAPDRLLLVAGGSHDHLAEPELVRWLQRSKTPYVLLCQSNDSGLVLGDADRTASRAVHQAATAVVFVSTHNQRAAERQLELPPGHGIALTNPIEPSRPGPLSYPPGPPWRFAVVGRIESSDKGLELLPSALALALGGVPGWRLDFFGTGPDQPALAQAFAQNGLDASVRFAGSVEDVATVWANHHVLVQPSRREGCSLALLEAMYYARPVVVTPVGGVSDWVVDEVSGFVAADVDATAIGAALRRAWDRRTMWPQMGAAAHAGIDARLDLQPESRLLQLLRAAPAGSSQPC